MSNNCLFAGVGGHGGAGIHADLESKYQEIIQRVSCHASPASPRKQEINEQKLDPKITNELGTCRSDTTFYSVGSDSSSLIPGQEQALLMGYGMDAVSVYGTLRQRHPLPSFQSQQQQSQQQSTQQQQQPQRRNTADQTRHAANQPQSPNQVEQVHVAKCAVCTIL